MVLQRKTWTTGSTKSTTVGLGTLGNFGTDELKESKERKGEPSSLGTDPQSSGPKSGSVTERYQDLVSDRKSGRVFPKPHDPCRDSVTARVVPKWSDTGEYRTGGYGPGADVAKRTGPPRPVPSSLSLQVHSVSPPVYRSTRGHTDDRQSPWTTPIEMWRGPLVTRTVVGVGNGKSRHVPMDRTPVVTLGMGPGPRSPRVP